MIKGARYEAYERQTVSKVAGRRVLAIRPPGQHFYSDDFMLPTPIKVSMGGDLGHCVVRRRSPYGRCISISNKRQIIGSGIVLLDKIASSEME
jgi:hypothetical protein